MKLSNINNRGNYKWIQIQDEFNIDNICNIVSIKNNTNIIIETNPNIVFNISEFQNKIQLQLNKKQLKITQKKCHDNIQLKIWKVNRTIKTQIYDIDNTPISIYELNDKLKEKLCIKCKINCIINNIWCANQYYPNFTYTIRVNKITLI